jgi:hypothetical protein
MLASSAGCFFGDCGRGFGLAVGFGAIAGVIVGFAVLLVIGDAYVVLRRAFGGAAVGLAALLAPPVLIALAALTIVVNDAIHRL